MRLRRNSAKSSADTSERVSGECGRGGGARVFEDSLARLFELIFDNGIESEAWIIVVVASPGCCISYTGFSVMVVTVAAILGMWWGGGAYRHTEEDEDKDR